MKENMHELPDFPPLLHELGIEYWWCQDVNFHLINAGFAQKDKSLRFLAGQNGAEGDIIKKYVNDASQAALKYHIRLKTYSGKSIFDRLHISTARQRCIWPWSYFFVNWEGFVSACCVPSQYYFGNLLEDSLEKIWNGDDYRSFRTRLKSGNLPEQCVDCTLL
jgi:radical SAM protein with 4Fe4S-binding SPASM domain